MSCKLLHSAIVPNLLQLLAPHFSETANFDCTFCSHDARLHLLDTPLPSTTPNLHPSKRTKLTTPTSKPTVAIKIQDDSYESVKELVADIDRAAGELNTTLGSDVDTIRHEEKSKAMKLHVASLKDMVNELVRREMVRKPQTFGQTEETTEDAGAKDADIQTGLASSGKMMLTLYGKGDSHYGPSRQLFSSLQKPASKKEATEEVVARVLRFKVKEEEYAPLRETALPNGIFASKNVPTIIKSESSKVPTLGTLFPAPSHLPQLTPPRQSKHTSTRDQEVNFFDPKAAVNAARPRNRTDHYTIQHLATGQWISYAAGAVQETKKRKRGQSFNKLTSPSIEETPVKPQAASPEELFKSAYYSFAPIRDDSTALIPEKLKNRVWWDRYGASRFSAYLSSSSIDYDDGINGILTENVVDYVSDDQMKDLEKAVKAYEPEETPPEFQTAQKNSTENGNQVSEKDVDELLAEISEAIETLVAHQRARNLISTSSTPAPAGLGSPSTPSTAELNVYNMLKDQLKLMVTSLPPYAVAKLNGDQLETLAITTRMPVQGEIGRGVMDDPEALSRARTTAATSAAIPPVVRQSYPSRAGYTSTPAAASSRYTATNNYSAPRTSLAASYPSQTYSGRDTATAHFNSYPPQQSSSAVRRPFAGSQPHHSSYTNGVPPRPSTYTSSHQYATATPSRPSQPNYQHRPPNSTPSYSNYNATTTLSGNTNSYSGHNNHISTPANSANYSYSSHPRPPTYSSTTSRPHYPPSTTATTSSANTHSYNANTYSTATSALKAPADEASRAANAKVGL